MLMPGDQETAKSLGTLPETKGKSALFYKNAGEKKEVGVGWVWTAHGP